MINSSKTTASSNPLIDRIRTDNNRNDDGADEFNFTDEDLFSRFNNLYNPNVYQDCIRDLKCHYKTYYLKKIHYQPFFQIIQVMAQSTNDENMINEIIEVFMYIMHGDGQLLKAIFKNRIFEFFFPFIRTIKGLDLFRFFLIKNLAPTDIERDFSEFNFSNDIDEKNMQLEKCIIAQNIFNTVAHFLIDNNISNILAEIFNTDKRMMVIEVLLELGTYTFTLQSLGQLLNELYPIIMNDPDLKMRTYAIEVLANFAGTSMQGLSFSIKNPLFIGLLTNPPLDTIEILDALLYYAQQAVQLSRYMNPEDLNMLISFAYNFIINASLLGNPKLLKMSLMVISDAARTSPAFTNFCIEKGIINTLIQMIDSNIPFACQKYAFIALCNFFYESDLNGAIFMWNNNFLEILSLYMQAMVSGDNQAVERALDAVNCIPRYSEKHSQCGEWIHLLFSNEEIVKALNEIACEPGFTGDYPEDSNENYAYSILLNEPRY